ncbi:MAG: Arm DNA-binding domain-containing protein [Actinomycetota bacterium]|nr:Arm DNA-binding domain-containing protein [Actinomycetota bacterium]
MNGSVFKRCTKCGRKVSRRRCGDCNADSFKWSYIVDVGSDADGRRVQQKRGGFATRAEADRALRAVLSSIEGGTFVRSSPTTLAQYLRGEWLPATAPPHVKYETWADRRRCLDAYVLPRLGGVELQRLNAAHLNRLYADLLRSGRARGPGGLSPTSVRRVHAMLRKALGDAVRWGRVERNAAELADPPPMKAIQAARRRSMRTWTEEQLRCFLAATTGHDLHPAWVFAAGTGVRRSELLGFRWSDLDLKAATATVRQTVLDSEDGHRLEENQKTALSARTLHLDRRTVAMLRAHRTEQAALRRAVGPAWADHDLVFTAATAPGGTPTASRARSTAQPGPRGCPSSASTTCATPTRRCCSRPASTPRSSPSGSATARSRSPWTPTPTSCRACSRRPRSCSPAWSSARPTTARPPRRTHEQRP